MIRFIVVSMILLINTIIQPSALFDILEINNTIPNSALIIVVSFAIIRGDVEGALIGFFMGLLQDVYFGLTVGFNATLLMIIGYFCGKPFKDFYIENYLLPIILTSISSFFMDFSFYIINYFFRPNLDFMFYFINLIVPSIVYNMIFCIPIYMIIYTINSKLEA